MSTIRVFEHRTYMVGKKTFGMKNSAEEKLSDEDANKILDEILEEDKKENEDDDNACDECESCVTLRAQEDNKFCECLGIAENSSRFSLRVMEAMRWLQQEEDGSFPTSSIEDIVNYIQANYRDDGDLYAQVRTVLKQVCSQGFVMELLDDEYYFIGPDAISMNQSTSDQKDSSPSPSRSPKRRRKSDDCLCEESRKTSRGKDEDKDDEDEEADCSCTISLTDEDADDCACEDEMHKSARVASKKQNTLQGVQGNNDIRFSEESDVNIESQTNFDRRNSQGNRRTTNGNDRRRTRNDELNTQESDDENDVYRELQALVPSGSKNHAREVKEWIKRCQEKCKQQGRQRNTNN